MTFADVPAGMVLFVDANVFVDHFAPNPATGASCTAFLRRVANQEIKAITSTHVIGEMAHRLLTLEACAVFGWPYKGIAQRLAGHPADIQKLSKYRQAIDDVPLFGVQVLPVVPPHLELAADMVLRHGLLFNDALVVALMNDSGLLHLASHDADFDRVHGLTRYGPI